MASQSLKPEASTTFPLDRIAPTKRPQGTPIGHQRWRSLLFAHWPVDGHALRRVVPPQLELDLWGGVAYVGIVPFWMEGVRPWWWPERMALAFWETNLRTYVLYKGRPGVYFFSLEATSPLAIWGARLQWGLPYYSAAIDCQRAGDTLTYRLQRNRSPAALNVRYEIGEWLGPSAPETIEHFLLERYLLFVQRRGCIWEGQVHHSPYPVQRARLLECQESLFAAAGLPPAHGEAEFVHYAEGVDVEIFGLRRA